VVVSEERGSIGFCFNGNIVTNLDGASLRQALLGLFGQRARTKRAAKNAGKRGSGSVTQTGTGSFRVTVPPPSGAPAESTREGGREATGSHAMPPPRAEAPPKSEKDPNPPVTRPMAPAKPIETPISSKAPDVPARPRED
ncbi:MAG TPA: hypothetical protein VIY73_20380, partial [Polyangiaceae bacterium]